MVPHHTHTHVAYAHHDACMHGDGPHPLMQKAQYAHTHAGGDGNLTKKELEETMKQMLAPPGGMQSDESALDRFTTDLTHVRMPVAWGVHGLRSAWAGLHGITWLQIDSS